MVGRRSPFLLGPGPFSVVNSLLNFQGVLLARPGPYILSKVSGAVASQNTFNGIDPWKKGDPNQRSIRIPRSNGLPQNPSWWLNHPFEKHARQIESFPQVREKINNVWNHHLEPHCDLENTLRNINFLEKMLKSDAANDLDRQIFKEFLDFCLMLEVKPLSLFLIHSTKKTKNSKSLPTLNTHTTQLNSIEICNRWPKKQGGIAFCRCKIFQCVKM